MRKVLAILFIFSAFSGVKAQAWLDIGLKGSYGFDLLFNKNIVDDQEFNQQLSTGFNVGGKLGFNFNDFSEVTFDVLYYKFNQKYKYNVLDPKDNSRPAYDRSIAFTGLDFLLMYRHNNDGRYVEIGPQYSIIQAVSGTDNHPLSTFSQTDMKNQMAPGYASLVFGFGGYFIGTENFGITAGVRLSYSFSDVISSNGQGGYFPANSSVYPTGSASSTSLENRSYSVYKPTHAMTAMFVMELNYDFAFLAKAKCQNKRKLVLF